MENPNNQSTPEAPMLRGVFCNLFFGPDTSGWNFDEFLTIVGLFEFLRGQYIFIAD
jgi:hypothetical protein